MKPNDKALVEALSVTQIPEENMREYMRRVLTAAYAAQFQSEDYAELVKELREWDMCWPNSNIEHAVPKAADAIEAVLADRDALRKWKEDDSDAMRIFARYRELEAERDALKAEIAEAKDLSWFWEIVDADGLNNVASCERTALRELVKYAAERDDLAARLAPVEPIERDKDDPTREYIPLPGGWEIQTKGKGSSYRLLDTKTGERHIILAGDAPFVEDFVTRMAKEINASAQVQPVAPVDEEALVEIAAKAQWKHAWQDAGGTEEDAILISGDDWHQFIEPNRVAIAAIRPHIEAAERERCAKIAEGSFLFDIETWLNSTKKEMTAHVAKAIAAAIRSGK